jgi:RNA polymerase sigma factor (sigma-70 family)
MATAQAGIVLQHIRELVSTEQAGQLPDRQLLDQFRTSHEEAAFAALVRRHGPLVLGVCRRVLGNAHDAEDAFQAAFLMLARKAHAIRKHESLGGWLYRVAFHAALRARRQAALRRQHERQAGPRASADHFAELTGRELLSVLDEEVHRLPERYRDPLVQCYLEGRTCDEAARSLDWAPRTLKRRLEQGRELLRTRLARRGLALPGALLAAGLTHGGADAAVPARLTEATVRAATGQAATAGTLARGVLAALGGVRVKIAAAVVLLAGLVALGAGALAQPAPPGRNLAIAPGAQVPALPQKGEAKAGKDLTVAGRVVGADGKALPDAEVVLVGWGRRGTSLKFVTEVLARGKTDEKGRFRLSHKSAPGQLVFQPYVVTGAKGSALEVVALVPRSRAEIPPPRDNLVLKLEPEQVLRLRLFNLEGQPARGVKVRVVYAARKLDPSSKDPAVRMALHLQQQQRMRRGRMQKGAPAELIAPERTPGGAEFHLAEPPADLALWPRTFTTDAQGRFELRGFAAGREVHLLIEDDAFARQEFQVVPAAQPKGKELTLALAPAWRIEGRLVYEDTGKPVVGGRLNVLAIRGLDVRGFEPDTYNTHVTDAQGRFSINTFAGDTFRIHAMAPGSEPYLHTAKSVTWERGAARMKVDLALPRGVTVRGKVVEAPGGKPRARVKVEFQPQRAGPPRLDSGTLQARSAEDGSFRLVVPPGPGHLLAKADDPNLISVAISIGELRTGKPRGHRDYADAVVPLNLKVKDDPKEVEVKVRRGVTVRGRVVGLDGKPVAKGFVFCPGSLLRPEQLGLFIGDDPIAHIPRVLRLEKGEFTLHGCDPDQTYQLHVTDAPPEAGPVGFRSTDAGQVANILFRGGKDRLGATFELRVKEAGDRPLTVRLTPCGSAEVRFVDAKGKPVKAQPTLEVRLTPPQGKVTAEWLKVGMPPNARGLMRLPGVSAKGGKLTLLKGDKGPFLVPDAKGHLTVPALIPGATYRLRGYDERDPGVILFEREFTAESGKTRRLGDIVPTQ